ncbi:gag-pol polyprotein [Tanacetum coccineum]
MLDSKSNINVSNCTCVESSNSVTRPRSKDNKSKDRVLKNTNDKRSSAHVRKMSSSVWIDSNKHETMHLNVCRSNASVLNTKTVNAVNNGLNIVCFSCGKDVFLLSYEKCVARYALSRDSKGDDLLTSSRKSNLYTISISELAASSPICLMSKATSKKSWLWHRRLSYLNFGTINQLTSQDLVNGLPKFKHDKDYLYSAYYATSPPEVSDNSAANTLDNKNTSSLSSIVVEEDEAPQIVSSSTKQVASEPNTLVLNENADEVVQEDVAEFDENVFYYPPQTPIFKEAESSSTYQDPSNMHEFYQTHRSTDKWTKNYPIKQVIGDPSKPVMIRHQLHTDAEVCMYALTVSTTELKNFKESILDASWIESIQDELNQFKRVKT